MALQDTLGADLVNDSFGDAAVVTKSDTIGPTTRLRDVRGIWADVAGTVNVITEAAAKASEVNGAALSSANGVSFTLLAGQVLPLKVAYVLSTGTAATGIKVLF